MALPATLRHFTSEEYLVIERRSREKSELVDGQMYAMTGATRKHNVITYNIAGELHARLDVQRCEAYVGDMRVRVPGRDSYHYPDVAVVCGDPEFEDDTQDTLVNPTVIVEVLSPSTALYDRSTKFENYARVASLTDYILVAQDRAHAEHFIRRGDSWEVRQIGSLDATIEMASIGCILPMTAIYRRIIA